MLPIRTLHLDSERSWRGGQNQVVLLLSELCKAAKPGDAHFLAATSESEILTRWKQRGGSALTLASNFFSLRNLMALVRFCREEKINILHAHTSKAHSLALCARFFLRGSKLVVHRRVDFVPDKWLLTSLKYLSPKVDAYVAISNAVKDILISIGVSTSKIAVVNSATDARLFDVRLKKQKREDLVSKFNLAQDTKILLSVAYFTGQKDHKTLLRALALLVKRRSNFYCLFAGGGPLLSECQTLAEELGLTDRVQFLGIRTDVVDLLLGADIFVMSSQWEALGTSILDAMLAQTCVVATSAGGIPEVITDGLTGKLCPIKDPAALSEAILDVLSDERKRQTLASQAHKKVTATFSVEKMAAGNRAVYANLIS
ncbi:MAG: glycosyltransferase family 4 protein [Oligoflexales bacterium]